MRRSPRPIRAGIFDMDGVLLDSEPLHHRAINTILADEGRAGLSLAEYSPYLGMTDVDTWDDLICRLELEQPVSFYRDRFDTVIVDQYVRHATIAVGARELLRSLMASGLPLAVASSSRATWVETCLKALGIRHYFDVVVGGDMVARGKPDPEIYLLAAHLLGIPPRECFAVEDSPKGIAAAVSAGMLTVAVATSYTENERTGTAHVHLRSLDEFDEALLARHQGARMSRAHALR
jgi:HAD superfamily hydrolase (TIGR01509 family)